MFFYVTHLCVFKVYSDIAESAAFWKLFVRILHLHDLKKNIPSFWTSYYVDNCHVIMIYHVVFMMNFVWRETPETYGNEQQHTQQLSITASSQASLFIVHRNKQTVLTLKHTQQTSKQFNTNHRHILTNVSTEI